MAVQLHELEARLNEARRHHPEVVVSMQRRCDLIGQHHQRDPQTPLEDDYAYRYKRTQWRCRVRITTAGQQTDALYWWLHGPARFRDEALDAILLRGKELPLHFDTHFWGRWGLRSDRMGVHLTNMMGFFKQYPRPPIRYVQRFYHGQPQFAAAIDQGLILARMFGTHIISCDTFKHLPLLSANERILWERLIRLQTR